MSSLCTLLGYSRQAYYSKQYAKEQEAIESDLIISEILRHRKIQPKLGGRKLLILLQDFIDLHKIKIGRDSLFDLLREHELLVKVRRSVNVVTTFSKHWYKKYPNLIKNYVPFAPNLLWVSDITYITLVNGFAYLSLITDAYSRKIVGFYLAETLESIGCITALQMAIRQSNDLSCLIHHSDRGVQYCSYAYTDLLLAKQIKISMTEKGDPLENAIAERLNGILKQELLEHVYDNYNDAQVAVAKAIAIYNSIRPHSSCDMLTPNEAHQKTGILKRHWKNYYVKKEVAMQ